MNRPQSFTLKLKTKNGLVNISFEEYGGCGNSFFRVFSKDGLFDSFNMVQNTNENPQEYIIQKRSNVPNEILEIEKQLSNAIRKQRCA